MGHNLSTPTDRYCDGHISGSHGVNIYLMWQHWDLHDPLGQMLKEVYEAFQIDLGLEIDPFTRKYTLLGNWPKTSWFSHLR